MKRISLILIVCFLASAQPCGAGTITQRKQGATLEIRFDAETPKLTLSDLITVTLTVEGNPSLRTPVAPLDLPPTAPWVLVERSGFPRENIDSTHVRYRLTYRFAPREPGKNITFHFPDVKFSEGASAEQKVSWDKITFEVETQIVLPDHAKMRDITAIEELPSVPLPDRSWQLWLSLGGVGVLLFGVILGARFFLRRDKRRSATQLAIYEWQRLVAMKLPERGRGERFITLLTTLVRRYLERQFAIAARRQTTPEFAKNLDQLTMLTAAERQFLSDFFEHCDAVKFAQVAMTADECMKWADAARAFLQSRLAAVPK
jgi:hypothetical protein